jgi:Rrf2 family protein
MHISAKVDYGLRALLVLAASDEPMTARALAGDQDLPSGFLSAILNDLRRAGIVSNQRGHDGGYRLARAAHDISVAEVMRALDGPLARVRGLRPEAIEYRGSAEHLQLVWIAVRAILRKVLEHVTLLDVIEGQIPAVAVDPAGTGTLRALPAISGTS